ncbi:marine proteobacterial sortase target protein [Shewanella psychrotolerans]|uniref:marine proteobacterial sortase target protein n=1 Tax=Shewanella psychrotolerans TaxID=2864206 RepID=UPI001C65A101|nr:marine proteobacterial sortase target protein [Shewanella psychrotolerans]QYK03006.1 marine proteobacterial sortase target protein [Shewanella psychrotolerans]
MKTVFCRLTNLCPPRGAFFHSLLNPIRQTVTKSLLVALTLLLPLNVLALTEDETPLGSAQLVYTYAKSDAGSDVDSEGEAQARFTALPVNTQVEMQVSGWLNRVTVKQYFHNNSEHWLNGTYQFPLPHDAAVDSMTLRVGERILEGEIKTKLEAKKRFEVAKASGQKASLVEQHKPNLFSTQVANLAPGKTLVVEIAYQQLVNYQQGEFSLRFPMAITPRYSPKNQLPTEPQAQFVAPSFVEPMLTAKGTNASESNNVSLHIELNGGMELSHIKTPYHLMQQTVTGDNVIELELTQVIKAERDFVLRWQPLLSELPTAVAFTQQGRTHQPASLGTKTVNIKPSDDSFSNINNDFSANQDFSVNQDYGLVMLMPPQDKSRHGMARELTLVIDTSGSMSGDSIVQAKRALLHALAGLGADDTFNIIAFESKIKTLSPRPLMATAANLERANLFVRELVADGGTEMAPAFMRALSAPSSKSLDSVSRLKQVVFITDGAIGNEEQLFSLIADHLGDSRLFTVGIGAAPNGYFMERAAQAGRGTYTYIGKLNEVDQKIAELMDKIEHPIVSNVELRLGDGTIPDYWPVNIGDLYAQEPVMVAVKLKSSFHQSHNDELIVSGTLGGQFWQRRLTLQRDAKGKGFDLLWARKQIAALLLSKNGSNSDRIKRQVTQVALDYHLVSPYTSLVAVDKTPSRPYGEASVDAYSSTILPLAVPGTWPQTASESRLYMAIGGMLLFLVGAYSLSFSGVLFRRRLGARA